ncbi:KEOPS complex subunit Cgi121 [Halobacterium sp. R2-5]|uniref:KEOPS complex subunit Cgi121 n=1 Tax=Halobacterium sp. R2-5 TaxID=2715751 RepID=UPI0014243C74|nr:KEOPS complex component [Halobacterium sp. R2-5]
MRLVAGTADVSDVDEFVAALPGDSETAVQAFDADYVTGRGHLAAAVEHADRAFERGENVASDRAVEILLYAAGRRQIREALEMGVAAGEQDVVVVVAGGDEADAAAAVAAFLDDGRVLDGEPLPGAVSGDRETIRAFFDVSEGELDAAADDLPGVVRERVALLDVEK